MWQEHNMRLECRNIALFHYRAHEQWGYCQAGTSALLTEDNMALIGAPGPFTWRGTVFAVSVEEDFLFRDKTHYHTPVKEGNAPVDKYSYLGEYMVCKLNWCLRIFTLH